MAHHEKRDSELNSSICAKRTDIPKDAESTVLEVMSSEIEDLKTAQSEIRK